MPCTDNTGSRPRQADCRLTVSRSARPRSTNDAHCRTQASEPPFSLVSRLALVVGLACSIGSHRTERYGNHLWAASRYAPARISRLHFVGERRGTRLCDEGTCCVAPRAHVISPPRVAVLNRDHGRRCPPSTVWFLDYEVENRTERSVPDSSACGPEG